MVKDVLEVIQVYWMFLAWIPKGVLEVIRCFFFVDSYVLVIKGGKDFLWLHGRS